MYVILDQDEYEELSDKNNQLKAFRDSLTFSMNHLHKEADKCKCLREFEKEAVLRGQFDVIESTRKAFDDVVLRGIKYVTFK